MGLINDTHTNQKQGWNDEECELSFKMCIVLSLRDMAKTPPCLLLPGLCVGIRSLLGHYATGRLGELRPGALWDLLHPGLVASTGLCVRPELCLNNPVLLSHFPHRHYRILLRHDHHQGQVLHEGGLAL